MDGEPVRELVFEVFQGVPEHDGFVFFISVEQGDPGIGVLEQQVLNNAEDGRDAAAGGKGHHVIAGCIGQGESSFRGHDLEGVTRAEDLVGIGAEPAAGDLFDAHAPCLFRRSAAQAVRPSEVSAVDLGPEGEVLARFELEGFLKRFRDFEINDNAVGSFPKYLLDGKGMESGHTNECSFAKVAEKLNGRRVLIFEGMMETIASKIWASREALGAQVRDWQRAGERVVFTNGCFDLLHYGHLVYLAEARGLGDRLVIGLNSDASVKRLKGAERPIWPEECRLFQLASLAAVDAVVLFAEDTPLELLEEVLPDVLVKGGDYRPEQIVGAELVLSRGGQVQSLSFVEGYSSSGLIDKIRHL